MRDLFLRLFGKKPQKSESEPQATQLQHADNAASILLQGTVSPSLEDLVGKRQAHYSNIVVDVKRLPIIDLEKKPANTEYLTIKYALVDRVVDVFSGYLDYVKRLSGICENVQHQSAIDTLFRYFVVRYWDCPASEHYHHARPWGLLEHSVYVACAEAEKGSSWTPLISTGIDEIMKARHLGSVVVAYFMRGLMHDAYKLYRLTAKGVSGDKVIHYSPLHRIGNLLDFKLICGGQVEQSWQEVPLHPGKLNSMEFWGLIPKDMFMSLPPMVLFDTLSAIYETSDLETDQESAAKDVRGMFDLQLEKLCCAISSYCKGATGQRLSQRMGLRNTMFLLSEDWVAVDRRLFFKAIGCKKQSEIDSAHACLAVKDCVAVSQDTADASEKQIFIWNGPMCWLFQGAPFSPDAQGKLTVIFLRKALFVDLHVPWDELADIFFPESAKPRLARVLGSLPAVRYMKAFPAQPLGRIESPEHPVPASPDARPAPLAPSAPSLPCEPCRPADRDIAPPCPPATACAASSAPPSASDETPSAGVGEDLEPNHERALQTGESLPDEGAAPLVSSDYAQQFKERLFDVTFADLLGADGSGHAAWLFISPDGVFLNIKNGLKALFPDASRGNLAVLEAECLTSLAQDHVVALDSLGTGSPVALTWALPELVTLASGERECTGVTFKQGRGRFAKLTSFFEENILDTELRVVVKYAKAGLDCQSGPVPE